MNSPGTQCVVGFAPKSPAALADVTIEPMNDYSVVMATALEADRTLADCDEALVLAIARVRNSGMKLANGLVADRGTAPTVIEPVQTKLTFARKPKEVLALDQDGLLTTEKLRLDGKSVSIDTGEYKTFYYLVRF